MYKGLILPYSAHITTRPTISLYVFSLVFTFHCLTRLRVYIVFVNFWFDKFIFHARALTLMGHIINKPQTGEAVLNFSQQ